MNNRLLIGAEFNNPRRFKRMPWSNQSKQVTGVCVFWSTVEQHNKFIKDMPFRVKLFHKIHTMVHHGGIGGQTKSWKSAARRLESHMVMWPDIQKEWY